MTAIQQYWFIGANTGRPPYDGGAEGPDPGAPGNEGCSDTAFWLDNFDGGIGSWADLYNGAYWTSAPSDFGTGCIKHGANNQTSIRSRGVSAPNGCNTWEAKFYIGATIANTNSSGSLNFNPFGGGAAHSFYPRTNISLDGSRRPYLNLQGAGGKFVNGAALTPGNWYRIKVNLRPTAGQTYAELFYLGAVGSSPSPVGTLMTTTVFDGPAPLAFTPTECAVIAPSDIAYETAYDDIKLWKICL